MSLEVQFNPLNFTTEEVNALLARGAIPAPIGQWKVTDRLRRIQEEERNGND